MANKRIMKEFQEITSAPPPGCKVSLQKEDDMNVWDVHMEGPSDSVYKDALFHITISLPKEYPFKPPTLSFRTKIYHPNVSNDERGAMCLGMLKSEDWKPPNKIKEVLMLVRSVLAAPQPEDAVEPSIADLYKNDREAFEREARRWVGKYAAAGK